MDYIWRMGIHGDHGVWLGALENLTFMKIDTTVHFIQVVVMNTILFYAFLLDIVVHCCPLHLPQHREFFSSQTTCFPFVSIPELRSEEGELVSSAKLLGEE